MGKVVGILKGTGLFVGGLFLGAMIVSNGDSDESSYTKEEPTKVVAKASEEKATEKSKVEVKKEEKPKEIVAQKVFEDNHVIAYYYGTESNTTKLIIENKTDIAIGVQDQTFGINGFSTTSNTSSITVTPHSKGILPIDLTEITGMYGTPKNIGGEIEVFNNDSYDTITTIKFNNVAITQ